MKKVLLMCFFVIMACACAPLISGYNEQAFLNATNLKAETIVMMGRASEEWKEHERDVNGLRVRLEQAYEYAKGYPGNELSAEQWRVLIDPEGKLIGKFLNRWEEKGKLGGVYIGEFQRLVSKSFDQIVCLEINKKAPARCGGKGR